MMYNGERLNGHGHEMKTTTGINYTTVVAVGTLQPEESTRDTVHDSELLHSLHA